MSLDGLRAWIGEVERKLGMRTRVFLVLTVIAIGGAGAAIYLALDARDSAVSESDVQALQQRLEARIDEGGSGATATAVAQLEAEVEELKTQVEGLSGEGGGSGAGKSEGGGRSKGASEGTGGEGSSGSGGASTEGPKIGATGGGASAAKLQELLEKAKEQSEANE
jgi:hypothetical protein